MDEHKPDPGFLHEVSAYQLAHVTKTPPQYEVISPRWVTRLLDWKELKSGVFRLNKVKEGETLLDILCSLQDASVIPETSFDYAPDPREYTLNSISTVLKVNTRLSDVYKEPFDQTKEQLRLSIESMKERQESLLINSPDYGLLVNGAKTQRIKTRTGPPTPDDLDSLIERVWKEPSFFLAHPSAVAAFGRECTLRGVPPVVIEMFGSPFITWRGIPIVPTDKLLVDGKRRPQGPNGKTNILLVRTGEKKQGVIGLYQGGLQGEQSRGLSVKYMGIDKEGYASYLLSLYCSAAVLVDDALGVLEDVEIGVYHDEKYA